MGGRGKEQTAQMMDENLEETWCKYRHTKGPDKTGAQHTVHTSNTSGGDSEFSFNMHALWLTHLTFPLVPFHTVLHSACTHTRLIGTFPFVTKKQTHGWKQRTIGLQFEGINLKKQNGDLIRTTMTVYLQNKQTGNGTDHCKISTKRDIPCHVGGGVTELM